MIFYIYQRKEADKMKVTVNRDQCIGCGACAALASTVFEIDDEGVSKVIVDEIAEEDEESVQDAIDSCPTSAIEEE